LGLRVDLRVPLPSTLDELGEFAVACEATGFDGIGIHDHPETGLDAYAAAGVALARTSRLEVYVAVTNLVTRHPLVLASIAGSMAQIAPGRFRMVVGAGNVGVRQVGESPTGLSEIGSGVRAIRRLLQGGTTSFAGAPEIALRSIPDVPPPILIASAGPRGLDEALAEGDGAFLLAGADSSVSRWVEARIGETDGFDVIRVVPIHVTKTLSDGVDWFARWWAALERSSVSSDRWIVRSVEQWAGIVEADLPLGRHRRTPKELNGLAEWVGVFGPPEYCRDRLSELHRSQRIERVYLWSAHLAESAAGIPGPYALPTAELKELGALLANTPP
jgi:5,10-methylenetetrahydromethanopterin reductase